MLCQQRRRHPAAPRRTPRHPVLLGAASCAPRGRAFPGTRCGDTHGQNLPPAGWLLPKGREAGAGAGCCLRSCLHSCPRDHPCRASRSGGAEPFAGDTSRLAAGAGGPVKGCARHLATHFCGDRRVLGTLGCPHQMLFIRVQGGPLAIRRSFMVVSTSRGEVLHGQRWRGQEMPGDFKAFLAAACVFVCCSVCLCTESIPLTAGRKSSCEVNCRLDHHWRCSCILF